MEEIRYVAGLPYADEILTFLLNKFRVQEPITLSLDATTDDVHSFFTDLRNGGVDNSIVAVTKSENSLEDELVGICLNHVDPKPEGHQSAIEFDPFKDYKEEVDTGPYKERNANRLNAFIGALEGDVHSTLGRVDRIFHVDVICVDMAYSRQGIASELLRRSLQHARDLDCDRISTVATAVASQHLFRKAGFYTIRELPFSCFRENRIPIFRNLPDGGRSGLLMAFTLKGDDEDDMR
ncbi:hypothetical protein PRIPAC_73312 [Pristionchus pacificus]|uniref:Acetyltransferase n=1 Tax=Pristionchus pacificus TaxID=54126 RepID=A0A2A6CG37_PRIPA|nr:hypothetical protein PRIPAC_73312 [Pristionchus pacificus]|eukprot:PDM77185.1 Acetyltransferase [Pristionchus pacificus]